MVSRKISAPPAPLERRPPRHPCRIHLRFATSPQRRGVRRCRRFRTRTLPPPLRPQPRRPPHAVPQHGPHVPRHHRSRHRRPHENLRLRRPRTHFPVRQTFLAAFALVARPSSCAPFQARANELKVGLTSTKPATRFASLHAGPPALGAP